MMSSSASKNAIPRRRGFWIGLLIIIASVLLLVIAVPGLRKGVRGMGRSSLNIILATLDRKDVLAFSQGDFTNIIFLHQSTGRNLIVEGHVREQLTGLGYNFWDQGYNHEMLRNPTGASTGYSYNVPGNKTDPDGMAHIFGQRVYPLPVNTFSGLLQYDVIIFKSCFDPTSHIESDTELEVDKADYLQVRDAIDQHPDKLFILLTQPPLNPAETNPAEAARARSLADWLASPKYFGERANLFVYNFYAALAVDDPGAAENNMLRAEYRNGSDSHPNELANEQIGPELVEFVIKAIDTYRSSSGD
jgi:hypothetical protein